MEVAIPTELNPMTTTASEGTTAHNGTGIKT